MIDLTEINIDDLVAEIQRRSDSSLVVWTIASAEHDRMYESEPLVAYSGGKWAAMGLATYVTLNLGGHTIEGDEDDD